LLLIEKKQFIQSYELDKNILGLPKKILIDIQTHTPAFWLGAGGFLVRFGHREGCPAQGIRIRLTLSKYIGKDGVRKIKTPFVFEGRFYVARLLFRFQREFDVLIPLYPEKCLKTAQNPTSRLRALLATVLFFR
jgi:hypothetical protein